MATGGLTAAPPLADDEMPAAKSGKRYSAKVASFHLLDLPESARSSKLAPFFQDDVSWPMSGPFFIRGDTDADATQLSLGRRVGGLFQFASWISTTVCSSNANGGGTRTRRLLLSLCSPVQFPCWEASLSGWRRFASPASCCVSGFQRFAWVSGTPGSGTPSPKVLFNMATGGLTAAPLADDEMPAAKSGRRYSATVASFHFLDLQESVRTSKLAPLFKDEISWPTSGTLKDVLFLLK